MLNRQVVTKMPILWAGGNKPQWPTVHLLLLFQCLPREGHRLDKEQKVQN